MTIATVRQPRAEDTAIQIRSALDALPRGQKEAIIVAFYGLGTYRDVARVLTVPELAVTSRIRDGLKTLAAVLCDKPHRS